MRTRAAGETANVDGVASVFVDESGYTGADLLNADQRVHAVAAVLSTPERARDLVARHFGAVKAKELKLASLVRRPTYRSALTAAMLELARDQGAVGYVYCKRYALWLHLLDDCVEPVCRRLGAPFYENGWNRSFASLLFATAARSWGAERTEAILSAYQAVARSKRSEDALAFLEVLRQVRGCELAEFFVPAMTNDRDVVDSLLHEGGTLDLSHPMALGLVSWLEERSSAPYRIVHDENKAIGKALHVFRALAAVEEQAHFEVSSHTKASFPLKFTEVVLADSRSDIRLQLADLFAGSVRLCSEMLLGFRPNDGLPDELLGRLPSEAFIFNVANLDFAETRTTFGGSDGARLIDFMTKAIADRQDDPGPANHDRD